MTNGFILTDVSSESIMNMAKVVSNAPISMEFGDIVTALENKWKENYLKQVITSCVQLSILQKDGNGYVVNSKQRDAIRRANKDELIAFFRVALQNYPPFLMYADLLSNGYSSEDSASMTRGIMKIGTSLTVVEKALRLWGTDTKLIVNEDGKLRIPEGEKGLPSNYVKDLLKALDSELHAKMFLIETLNPEVYNYLTSLEMDISELAKALIEYEQDPKQSLNRASQFFEIFLAKFGIEITTSLQGKNGVNEMVKALSDNGKILTNQKNLGNGLGGCRNISAHGVDKETQKEWNVSPQASLSAMLLIPAVIRSYYFYVKKQQQEF